jgi:hypothetical protein
MIGRIEEGIESRTTEKAETATTPAASRDSETGDEASPWSLASALASILDLLQFRSDPSVAPP